jgi:hypothetical protein
MRVTCPGAQVMTGAEGQALCLDSLGEPVAWEVVAEFEPSMLEAEDLAGAFAAGFIVVGTGWAIGRGFKYVLSLLR